MTNEDFRNLKKGDHIRFNCDKCTEDVNVSVLARQFWHSWRIFGGEWAEVECFKKDDKGHLFVQVIHEDETTICHDFVSEIIAPFLEKL